MNSPRRFHDAGLLALNLVSSPGTGKTAFLERTLRELQLAGEHPAALVGDLETDNDSKRLAASGAPVRQINTHGCCHLEADMIGQSWKDGRFRDSIICSSKTLGISSVLPRMIWVRRSASQCFR